MKIEAGSQTGDAQEVKHPRVGMLIASNWSR